MLPVGRSQRPKQRRASKKFSPKRRLPSGKASQVEKKTAEGGDEAASADPALDGAAPSPPLPVAGPSPSVERGIPSPPDDIAMALVPQRPPQGAARPLGAPSRPPARSRGAAIASPLPPAPSGPMSQSSSATDGKFEVQKKMKMVEFCTQFKPSKRARIDRERRERPKKKEERKRNAPGSLAARQAESSGGRKAEDKLSGPRVQIVNGQIVLQEESLEVGGPEATPEEALEEVHEETAMTATYASFVRRNPADRWTAKETKRFFEALRMVGTDFTMMLAMFPDRNRRQLKAKWRKEEKMHPELVTKALNSQVDLDTGIFDEVLDAGKEGSPEAEGKKRKAEDRKKRRAPPKAKPKRKRKAPKATGETQV